MIIRSRMRAGVAGLALAALLAATPAHAELSAEELAKLAQNPVGNLISVPFQNNTNLNFGPEKGTQNILNIQPVIPISVNDDWNVITRTIVPVISHAAPRSGRWDGKNGIGDTVFTAFLSPANPGPFDLGCRPGAAIADARQPRARQRQLGAGPSIVVLHMEHGDPWVYGVLANNVWSLTDDKSGGKYNNGLIQPFVNYNFKGGLYLTSAPIATVDWKGAAPTSGRFRSAAASARSSTSANCR